jgi:hypothetical protein
VIRNEAQNNPQGKQKTTNLDHGYNPPFDIVAMIREIVYYYLNGKGTLPRVAPIFKLKDLETIFRHKAFKMLLSKGKITQDTFDMLMSWRHSGLAHVCFGVKS